MRRPSFLGLLLCGVLLAALYRSACRPPLEGLVLGVEDGTTKIFRERHRFRGERTRRVALSLARNEAESFQVALFHAGSPVTVTVEVSALRQAQGAGEIPAADIRTYEVGYVRTTRPDYAVEAVGWWPDPLTPATQLTVPAGQVQPLWVTIRTRETTVPGRYTGAVRLTPSEGEPVVLLVEVTVWRFALPTRGHLQTAFDIYPNRLRQAYERLYPAAFADRPDRWDYLEALMREQLLEARLSPMWHVDPRAPGMDAALGQAEARGLTAFALGRQGGSFDNDWPREPEALADAAAPYRAMAKALRAQGRLEAAYLYAYDEPAIGAPHVAEVAAALHRADPALRTLVALGELRDPSQDPAWWRDLDIICVRNTVADSPHVEALRRLGKTLWLYASGPTGTYPTLVIDAPAMAARILPWMAWKLGARGLLYWCVNFWTTDPWTEPRNTPWGQHGNGSLFYPGPDGPVGSIRLEALRDGMEDYEYLERLARAGVRRAVPARLASSMAQYRRDADAVQRERLAMAALLEQLEPR